VLQYVAVRCSTFKITPLYGRKKRAPIISDLHLQRTAGTLQIGDACIRGFSHLRCENLCDWHKGHANDPFVIEQVVDAAFERQI